MKHRSMFSQNWTTYQVIYWNNANVTGFPLSYLIVPATQLHTCQPREKFSRDKQGAIERSEPVSEGGSGGPPRKFSKTYIANGAISVIPELYL